jgi:hypothetical protein
MDPAIIHEIFKRLKSKKGRKVYDLGAIPESARYSDARPLEYYPIKELRVLIEWNLVEAYKVSRLIPPKKLDDHDIGESTFYLSPHTVTLEDTLRIDLSAKPFFGKPQRSKLWTDVLMLMPFTPKLKPIFDDHVRKVASALKLSAGRADDFFTRNSVMQDIWSAIYYAKVIVADCTKRNPNVFYEIGIAHTLGKDTILISQSLKDIPFDLRHLRIIVYEFTPKGMTAFEQELEWALRRIKDKG